MPQTWLAGNTSQHFNIVYPLPSLYHCVFNCQCHCSAWPAVCSISLCIWPNICYINGVPKIEIISFFSFLILNKTHFNYSTVQRKNTLCKITPINCTHFKEFHHTGLQLYWFKPLTSNHICKFWNVTGAQCYMALCSVFMLCSVLTQCPPPINKCTACR